MRDLYDIIGVNKSDSKGTIKKAYRKIAMKHHPDRNPGDTKAEQKFKEAAEAYAVLRDEKKRARYDQFGHAGVGMGDAAGGAGAQGFGGGIHMSMDDIFNQFGDIFGGHNPFQDIFGGGGGSRSKGYARKAKDLRVSIKLEPIEILNGTEKKIRIHRNETCTTCQGSGVREGASPSRCRHCGGSGQVRRATQTFFGQSVVVSECPICHGEGTIIENPCRDCSGNGITRKSANITIKVPKGVASGNYMTLEGQGNKGGKGVHPGDLLVFIEEKDHSYFTRHGEDVFIETVISFSQAALGDSIEIPTIEGKAKLSIPKGIQSGQILRMKGKGYPKLRGSQRGDQLVRIQIKTPDKLSKEEKILFENLYGISKLKPIFRKVDL
ncbi:MAG: molecular chaperone DnaJ [Candidatus Marinimicrobia bacterium]|nr:molecular chaperone DnaJ [Candidatus Neomarinimicrobiota bacterium]